ncbi:hypothetical protein DFH11DRAFT_1541839 [Phellopilus nigrolimitatus]|nr:hypothetical protein DFH11DRAFT_1541839 [Phellopilus nigrolimitatus]
MALYKKNSSLRRTTALVLLALAGLLLLKGLSTKNSKFYRQGSSTSVLSVMNNTERFGFDASDFETREGAEVEITGYWKEVRASLGLPPLPSIVAVATSPYFLSGDAGDGDDSSLERDGLRLDATRDIRHLGRLDPALRRRRLLFSFSDDPEQLHERKDQTGSVATPASLFDMRDPRARIYDYTDDSKPRGAPARANSDHNPDVPTSEAHSYTDSRTQPDLFLAPDAQHSPPHTPTDVLAASFRAIAVRELRAKVARERGRTIRNRHRRGHFHHF